MEESYQQQYDGQQYESMIHHQLYSDTTVSVRYCEVVTVYHDNTNVGVMCQNIPGVNDDEGDNGLQQALAMSLHGDSSSSVQPKGNFNGTSEHDSEADLQSALQMSLATDNQTAATTPSTATTIKPGGLTDEYASMLMFEGDEMEDPELAMALQFSLQDR